MPPSGPAGARTCLAAFAAVPAAAGAAELNSHDRAACDEAVGQTELADVAGGYAQTAWVGPSQVVGPQHFQHPLQSPWWPYTVQHCLLQPDDRWRERSRHRFVAPDAGARGGCRV
jgi:hypothetical protein